MASGTYPDKERRPVILDQTGSVWRKTLSGANYLDTQVLASVRCGIVPISRLDMNNPYAYESTHLLWVPYWLMLRKEDQLRVGRRAPDAQGDLQPRTFTVNGRRSFTMGIPQLAYYGRELD